MHAPHRLFSGLAILTTLALTIPAAAQDADAQLMQRKVAFEKQVTRTLTAHHLLYLPQGYDADPAKRWPLILFLHGAGERGADLAKVAVHGPPKLVKNGQHLPFILVSPQCPEGSIWSNEALLALLDDVEARYRVDKSRVYLTGLSMGGFGTWSLGLGHPERFAAIAPICGGGDRITLLLTARDKVRGPLLKSLPIWAFHGAKDPVVALAESERMVELVKKAGNPAVKLTVYPEAQHDSWTATYDNPELYTWFLAHRRER